MQSKYSEWICSTAPQYLVERFQCLRCVISRALPWQLSGHLLSNSSTWTFSWLLAVPLFAVTSWSNNPRRLTFRITEEVKRSSMNFISTVGKQNACPLECIVKQHCSQAVYIRALPNPTIYHSQLIEYQITVSDATTQTITPLGINLAPVTYFHSHMQNKFPKYPTYVYEVFRFTYISKRPGQV